MEKNLKSKGQFNRAEIENWTMLPQGDVSGHPAGGKETKTFSRLPKVVMILQIFLFSSFRVSPPIPEQLH